MHSLFGPWFRLPFLLLLVFGACDFHSPPELAKDAAHSPATGAGSSLSVVATHSILGDWVRVVGGAAIHLEVLVGPDGDAHTYEPTPRDSIALSNAQLVFENGLQFEGWLDELFSSSGSSARRCVVSDRLELPRRADSEPNDSAELDPHVWQSPRMAIEMVRAIVDELSHLDPDHAPGYSARGMEYIEQLKTLEREIQAQVESIPEKRRVLVTTHDTFGYYAADFGFQILSVTGSLSSEQGEPSAQQLAASIRRIRDEKVPAIFTENMLDSRITEQVAREAGVQIVSTLYTDALGPSGSPGETYLGMMRHNARVIVEALR